MLCLCMLGFGLAQCQSRGFGVERVEVPLQADLAEEFGIQAEGAHRALNDVLVLAKVRPTWARVWGSKKLQ